MANPDHSSVPAASPAAGGAASSATSPTASTLLCRFEFETGRGNEGTKILMLEWDVGALHGVNRSFSGNDRLVDWAVSWEGKTAVLPVKECESDTSRRLYFLLPPGAAIPTQVTLSHRSGPTLHSKPLPAIFAPGLGVDAADAGKRGVLHSRWAKRRLVELQAEIEVEMKANGESVGLEMAAQEMQWINDHFGLGPARPSPSITIPAATSTTGTTSTTSTSGPQSPRSPVSGRLSEKLKGLRLATSPTDLTPSAPPPRTKTQSRLQSIPPGASDVDLSIPSSPILRNRNPPKPSGEGQVASLGAMLRDEPSKKTQVCETEDELFALPMSPRSPEMAKSPFSML